MQVNIELALRTREVFRLFERKINGDRFFIDTILFKFSIVMKHYKQHTPGTWLTYKEINQTLLTLTRQFGEEIDRFETMMAKRKDFDGKKIDFIAQFHTIVTVRNSLSMDLIEFIETYDKLIAVLKLLHLAGCFSSNNDYYGNVKRIQKLANQILSQIMLSPVVHLTHSPRND